MKRYLAFGMAFGGLIQVASAQATGIDIFLAQSYTQTGSNVSLNGYYAAERVDLTNGGSSNPTGVTVTRPNGTIGTLNYDSTPEFLYQTGLYSSLSSFNSDWGFGDYTFKGDGVNYSGVVSNNNVMWVPSPVTIANTSDFSNYDGVNDFTVDFSAFTPDPNASSGTTFVSLYNMSAGGALVGSVGGAFDPSTTAYTIAGGLLAENTTYQLVIDDDNRFYGPGVSLFQGATPTLSYDENTAFTFTTTPEPAPFAMLGLGVLGLLVRRRAR